MNASTQPSRLANAFYWLHNAIGLDEFVWNIDSRCLRILMYHGVCADQVADCSWVPRSFVTVSEFDRQMAFLKDKANVLSLGKAVELTLADKLPKSSVVITFDDGYANNLTLAYPVLKKYGLPATIFLSTAYVESGELFVADRLRLIAQGHNSFAGRRNDDVFNYSSRNLDAVLQESEPLWSHIDPMLTDSHLETLRPLRIAELTDFDSDLITLAPHSHDHCILGNEGNTKREWEIVESIKRVRDWTNQPVKYFAYPNGQNGDFGAWDKQILAREGVVAACTSMAGAVRGIRDPYELSRYPVGLFHRWHTFKAEITGVRTVIRNIAAWRERPRRGIRNRTAEVYS